MNYDDIIEQMQRNTERTIRQIIATNVVAGVLIVLITIWSYFL